MWLLEHDAGNHLPINVWAGQIVDDARAWLVEMGSIVFVEAIFKTPMGAVNLMQTLRGTRFLSFEGAVHPSAHFSGRSPSATNLFKATYSFANAMLKSVENGQLTLDLNGIYELMGSVDAQATRDMIVGLNELGIPNENGFLPKDLSHLRKMCWPADLPILQQLQRELKSQEVFLAFLKKMPAVALRRLEDDAFRYAFYAMMAILSKMIGIYFYFSNLNIDDLNLQPCQYLLALCVAALLGDLTTRAFSWPSMP